MGFAFPDPKYRPWHRKRPASGMRDGWFWAGTNAYSSLVVRPTMLLAAQ